MRADQLDADRACVLVIDMQEKLLPLIRGHERLVNAAAKLLRGAGIFRLPVIATEQYVKGLGPTVAPIRDVLRPLEAHTLEKSTFSAGDHPPVREALLKFDRSQVIIIGIEAHVCVQQTALDLASRDYDVFVCADAVGSRGRIDYDTALTRMRQNGVLVTTVESVLFELCGRCDAPRFKEMLDVIKASPPPED